MKAATWNLHGSACAQTRAGIDCAKQPMFAVVSTE
jgi:hypothetical protein